MRSLPAILIGLPSIATAAARYDQDGNPQKAVLAVIVMAFFIALWAIAAENGPLNHWARKHTVAAVMTLILIPVCAAFFVG